MVEDGADPGPEQPERDGAAVSKYRKRPVVVEAFLWTGDIEQTEDPVWIVEAIHRGQVSFHKRGAETTVMNITTLEGVMTAIPGDWIIKGIEGEIYPCKPEIFAASYEKVQA